MEPQNGLKELTLWQILDQTAAKFPDNEAIVYNVIKGYYNNLDATTQAIDPDD